MRTHVCAIVSLPLQLYCVCIAIISMLKSRVYVNVDDSDCIASASRLNRCRRSTTFDNTSSLLKKILSIYCYRAFEWRGKVFLFKELWKTGRSATENHKFKTNILLVIYFNILSYILYHPFFIAITLLLMLILLMLKLRINEKDKLIIIVEFSIRDTTNTLTLLWKIMWPCYYDPNKRDDSSSRPIVIVSEMTKSFSSVLNMSKSSHFICNFPLFIIFFYNYLLEIYWLQILQRYNLP